MAHSVCIAQTHATWLAVDEGGGGNVVISKEMRL